mgnify:CR=1 FL=1
MAFRYNNSPDRSEELFSFLFLHLSCHLLRFCRRLRSYIISTSEAVYDIRNHIEDFGDGILMFDIHELCHAVLDHEDGTGAHLRAHTAAAICLCGLCKGTAPVYPQVKWLKEHGIDADVIMGSKTKDLLILEDELKAVAGNLYVTTDDGSYERKGMGTDVIKDLVINQGKKYDVCVAIGPMIMMKFVCKLTKELGIPTIVSMNPIMVDGTGMCGACRLVVGDQVKFACVDGPEFDGHLVDFDQAMSRQQQYKTEEGRAMLALQEGDTHHGGCGHCGGDK